MCTPDDCKIVRNSCGDAIRATGLSLMFNATLRLFDDKFNPLIYEEECGEHTHTHTLYMLYKSLKPKHK